MPNIPKLSIITVVLNGADFIESCLKNVIAQDCPRAEHLVIDGGSRDATISIVETFMSHYPHIRLLSEPGLNQAAAMNRGAALAQGEIIGFLNDDDYYNPGVLKRILGLFDQLPEPAFLVGNCNIRDLDEKIIEVNKPQKLELRDLLTGNQFCPHPVNPSAYFYHKSLHRIIGPYRTDENYALDLDFILRAIQKAHVRYLDETWGNFRFIAGTKTFEDNLANEAERRERQVLDAFYRWLSLPDKMYIKGGRFYYKSKQAFRFCLNCLRKSVLTCKF